MAPKTRQLQIRVSAREKARLKRLAAAAGMDVSAYVMARALPPRGARVEALLRALAAADEDSRSYVLADLNDLLAELTPAEFADVLAEADVRPLGPYLRNYVAAMIELAAYHAGVPPPAWTAAVEPLEEPRFATPLAALRPHLLRAAPVPFKRRNIFVDASIGDRV